VFHVAVVEHREYLWVSPGAKRAKYQQYREAWKLMAPTAVEPATAEVAPYIGHLKTSHPRSQQSLFRTHRPKLPLAWIRRLAGESPP